MRSHTPAHPSLYLLDRLSSTSRWLASLYFFYLLHVFFFLLSSLPFLPWQNDLSFFNSLIYFCLFISLPPSQSPSSRCQASFSCMLYMHSLSMPSQILQVALIFLSGRLPNKTEERGVKYRAVRSSKSDHVQTVRSKYRTNPGLGKYGSTCLLRIAFIRFLCIFKLK